jgi:hypothetical protein
MAIRTWWCAGSGGRGGDPHGAAGGAGRGSRGGGKGGSSPNVLTPPPLAGMSAWAGTAAVVAGGARGWGQRWWCCRRRARRWWSCMRRQRRTRCGRWSRRRRPWRRGGAGRGGSPGEADWPWRRLRPRERGGGGAEARGGEGRRLRSSPRRPGRCTRALQCSGPGGAGSSIGVPTAADGGASERSPSAAARPVCRCCCCCGGGGGNPWSAVVAVWKHRPGRSIWAMQPGPGGGCVPGSAAAVAQRRGGGGGRPRHSSPRWPCSARVHHSPGGAGRGIGVPTAADGGASPQPTALPLPSHRPPSPPRLPTLPRDPPPPATGVQDALRLPRRRICALCCGR